MDKTIDQLMDEEWDRISANEFREHIMLYLLGFDPSMLGSGVIVYPCVIGRSYLSL